ncbi:MAG: glycosyltransferase family 2 protein [Pontiella sp.]
MKISLIITAYNRADALKIVLQSVAAMRVMPHEVIVADDGSGVEVAELVASMQSELGVPLKHVWQKDQGFRAARSRNLGIAASEGEYIVFLDGDMMVHPRFVDDHIAAAREGCFVQGGRVILKSEATEAILTSGVRYPGILSSGIGNRKNTLRLPAVASFLRNPSDKMRGIRSCNQGFWRADLLKVNGFDEAFTGWGREDSELVVRLYNAGIKRLDLKFGGIAYHLYHPERPRTELDKNDDLLAESHQSGRIVCEKGLSQHLNNGVSP